MLPAPYSTADLAALELEVRTLVDVSTLRAIACQRCRVWGLSTSAGWSIAIALSEAASNAVVHAGGGHARLWMEGDAILFTVEDHGAGIEGLDQAVRDHVSGGRDLRDFENISATNSMGTGFGAMLRLMDDVEIDTVVGGGTCVRARRGIG